MSNLVTGVLIGVITSILAEALIKPWAQEAVQVRHDRRDLVATIAIITMAAGTFVQLMDVAGTSDKFDKALDRQYALLESTIQKARAVDLPRYHRAYFKREADLIVAYVSSVYGLTESPFWPRRQQARVMEALGKPMATALDLWPPRRKSVQRRARARRDVQRILDGGPDALAASRDQSALPG